MKNFRRVCFAIMLTAAFTMPALAGDQQGPSEPNPGDVHVPGAPSPGDMNSPPGETSTPPSAQTQGADVAAPGDILTPGLTAILFAIEGLLG